MKNLPLGIQTFKNVIEENKLYVDKTKDIYEFFKTEDKYFFLSRPRRFGKSLLVTTLKEIFLGNQELFKGLWIYDKIEWQKYPVIHIDFSGMDLRSPEIFLKSFNHNLDELYLSYNLETKKELDYKDKFKKLIQLLGEKVKVVILIDEYDKPIIDFIEKKDIAFENRNILKGFYEVLKASEQYIRFVFLTGVSKFSRVFFLNFHSFV